MTVLRKQVRTQVRQTKKEHIHTLNVKWHVTLQKYPLYTQKWLSELGTTDEDIIIVSSPDHRFTAGKLHDNQLWQFFEKHAATTNSESRGLFVCSCRKESNDASRKEGSADRVLSLPQGHPNCSQLREAPFILRIDTDSKGEAQLSNRYLPLSFIYLFIYLIYIPPIWTNRPL